MAGRTPHEVRASPWRSSTRVWPQAPISRVTASSMVYEFGPEGTTFAMPVRVTMPTDGSEPMLLRGYWSAPDGTLEAVLAEVGPTEGTLEVRKYCDLGGRTGADHLFLVDGREVRRFDCSRVELPFARLLLDDVRARTETAMAQSHCFAACELTLRAQAEAVRAGHLKGEA